MSATFGCFSRVPEVLRGRSLAICTCQSQQAAIVLWLSSSSGKPEAGAAKVRKLVESSGSSVTRLVLLSNSVTPKRQTCQTEPGPVLLSRTDSRTGNPLRDSAWRLSIPKHTETGKSAVTDTSANLPARVRDFEVVFVCRAHTHAHIIPFVYVFCFVVLSTSLFGREN